MRILLVIQISLMCALNHTVSSAEDMADATGSLHVRLVNSAETSNRPGFYRLEKSADSRACPHLGRIINSDIKTYGNTRFQNHGEFLKWRAVDETKVDRGDKPDFDGPIERALADLNNDGVEDELIRMRWSMNGALNDSIYVRQANDRSKIEVATIIKSDKKIMFNVGPFWLNRNLKKYGGLESNWLFDAIASIDVFKENKASYLVAQSHVAREDISAKIYVFRLGKDNEPIDACMFVRVCPCGGCEDLRGDEARRMLPAPKWCNK